VLNCFQFPGVTMAKFSEVFSITLKVLGALLLISVAASVIYAIFVGIGKIGNSAGGSSASPDSLGANSTLFEMADQKHTRVPLSQWNKIIEAAIKVHCPLEGMTREQVSKSVGEPKTKTTGSQGEVWNYERDVELAECVRYNGDSCAEHKTDHQTATYYFSPSGNLAYPFEDHLFRSTCFDEPFYSKYLKGLP
jgi:hypothetical protein